MSTDTLSAENSQHFALNRGVSVSEGSGMMEEDKNPQEPSQMENPRTFRDMVKLCFEQNGMMSSHVDTEGKELYEESEDESYEESSEDCTTDLVSILKESIEAADDVQLGYGHLNSWVPPALYNEDSCSSAPYLKLSLTESTTWLQRLDPNDPFFQDLLRLHDSANYNKSEDGGIDKEGNNNESDVKDTTSCVNTRDSDKDTSKSDDKMDVEEGSVCSKKEDEVNAQIEKDLEEERNKPLQDGGNINLAENPVTSLRNLVNRIPRIFGHLNMSTVLPSPQQVIAMHKEQEAKKSNFYDIPIKKNERKGSSTLEQMLVNKDVPIEDFAKAMQSIGTGHLYSGPAQKQGLLAGFMANKSTDKSQTSVDSDKIEIVISDSEEEDESNIAVQHKDESVVAKQQDDENVVAKQQEDAEIEMDEDVIDVMTFDDNDNSRNMLLGVQKPVEVVLSENEENYDFQPEEQNELEDGEVVDDDSYHRQFDDPSNEISIEATDVDSLLEQFEVTAGHLNLPPTPADSPENAVNKGLEDIVINHHDEKALHHFPKLPLLKSHMPTPPSTPTIAQTATTITSTLSVAQITKKIMPVKRKSTILMEPLSMPAKKARSQPNSCPNSRPTSQPNSRASSPGAKHCTGSVISESEIPYTYQELVIDHDYCQTFPKIEDKIDSGSDRDIAGISSIAAQRYGNKFKIKKKSDASSPAIAQKHLRDCDPKVTSQNMQAQCNSVSGVNEWDSPIYNSEELGSVEEDKPHVTVRYFDKIPEYFTHKLTLAKNDTAEKDKSPEKPFISIEEKSPVKTRRYRKRSSYSYSRSRSRSRSRSYSPSYSSSSSSSRYSRRHRRSRHRRYSYSDSSSRSRSRSWSPSCSRSRSRHHRRRSRSYSYSRSRSRSYSPHYRSSRSRGHRRHRYSRRHRHRRRHYSSYSRSRSRSWSPYRSRSRSRSRSAPRHCSRSPIRRRLGEVKVDKDQKEQWEDRRVVYVGRIEEGITRAYLRERFSRFGEIDKVSVHFRDYGDNYAFITFKYKCDAIACIDRGNSLSNEPHYDLCFGGRRHFCKTNYADLDGKSSVTEKQGGVLDFDSLLKQAQTKIHKY
ncbi:uncharacterized protein LOC144446119 [Glandiceps talaboti]